MIFSFPTEKEVQVASALVPEGDNFLCLKSFNGFEILLVNTRSQIQAAKDRLFGLVHFCPVYRDGKQAGFLVFLPAHGLLNTETLKVLEFKIEV